jgi:hypothetical protein
MAEVRYCHQCARDNAPSRKFCMECRSPLLLIGDSADHPRICRNCEHVNASFAYYCTQCSSPLLVNPPKSRAVNIPIALKNSHATGRDGCPACAKPVSDLVSNYVRETKSKNREGEIRDNAGFTYGNIGTRVKIDSGLREPRKGCSSGLPQTLFTGTFGCALTLILAGFLLSIISAFAVHINGVLLIVIAAPIRANA